MVSTAHRNPSNVNQVDLFDSLDDYSILGILDWIRSFGDLATVASMSPRAHQMIQRYNLFSNYDIKNATLLIEIEGNNQLEDVQYRSTAVSRNRFLCAGLDHLLATLQVFCPIFGQLDITLNYFRPHGDFELKIVDYINRYCSTVPQKFTIESTYNPVLEFTAWNASSVKISMPELLQNFSIATHFPRVEELHIRNHDYFTSKEHLPHLKHLEITDRICGHFNIRVFAGSNPHITSAELDLCDDLNYLQEVNILFPKLMALRYRPKKDTRAIMQTRYENDVRSVRFANVKSYTIDLRDYFRFYLGRNDSYYRPHFAKFSQIKFDELVTLKYISEDKFYKNGQLDFVGQYDEVKSLDYSSFRVSYDDVWHLVDSLPNLKEITFAPHSNCTDHDDLWRLMKETNLEIIRASIVESLVREFSAIALPAKWTLEGLDEDNYICSKSMTFSRNRMA